MAARTANALWEGSLKEGRGQMAVGSGAFEGSYSFQSRFGDDDTGTNPEELVAAALSGCYSMQLAAVLGEAGTQSESVQSTANVTLRNVDGAPTITKIALTTRAKVPGIEEAAFQEAVDQAKAACLIARALAGVQEITVDASLEN